MHGNDGTSFEYMVRICYLCGFWWDRKLGLEFSLEIWQASLHFSSYES
jgi:hypothetical protein